MYNAMSQAFINAGIVNHNGRMGVFKQGWSASLSYKTRMALRNQGMPV